MPVIIVSGTDYEMGFQYGQQAGRYIELMKYDAWSSVLERCNRIEVLRRLKGFQHCIMRYTPGAIEMMKGLAAGATVIGHDVSYTDILLINCEFNLHRLTRASCFPSGAEGEEFPPQRLMCSSWSAWGTTTANGKLIGGDSGDGEFGPFVAIVAFPASGNSFVSIAQAGWLAQKSAINSSGLFVGVSGGFPTRPVDYDYGVPYPCAMHQLLRFADGATEAKEMFLSMPCDITVMHFSDVHGRAFVVERTAALKTFRKSGDYKEVDFLYSSNNFFNEEMRAAVGGGVFVPHAGWLSGESAIGSIPRNLEMWNMLHYYRGRVDLEFAKMMWRFPGNPPPYPLDYKAVNLYHETLGKDWDQKICNQDNAFVGIGLPDDGDSGVMHVCTGPAGRVAHPLGPIDANWYQVDGTHSFYMLNLAANPAAVAGESRIAAHDYIGQAHRELVELTYSDVAYSRLKQLYARANAEYYRGNNAYNRGRLANKASAVGLLAQATTWYTRAQAHAKQVYNALIVPANCPEALGLTRCKGGVEERASEEG
jgi:hypothetical protein